MEAKLIENTNNYKVYSGLDRIEIKTKAAIRKGMFNWAKHLKKTAKEEIRAKDKTGRVYFTHIGASGKRLKNRRRHKSSAPGQSHANLSGGLLRSLAWKVTSHDRLEFGYGVEVVQAPDYADFVEFGTPKGQMKARPTLQNTIAKTMGDAESYFNTEIEKIKL